MEVKMWSVEDKRAMVEDLVTAGIEVLENKSLSDKTRETIDKALTICLVLVSVIPEEVGVRVLETAIRVATQVQVAAAAATRKAN
jgi:hypothetical protein